MVVAKKAFISKLGSPKTRGIVATSVPFERIFSKTGQIINDRRTRLQPNKVKQLIFLNANDKFISRV